MEWLSRLRRVWSSATVPGSRRAQISRRLHLANLGRLRGLLVAVIAINVCVLGLMFVVTGHAREVLGHGPLVVVLTIHRVIWVALDLGALAVLGRSLAVPGPTERLARVETGVIAANMLMVVSLIVPLYPYYHTVSLFYVAVFSLVPLIRLDPARSALAIAAPALVLLAGILLLDGATPVTLSNAVNLAAMALLSLISARFLYAERVRDIHQSDTIARQQAKLVRLALTDELTGLANRRSLATGLRREWRRAVRDDQPLSLIMLDIDHFKRYNDAHGHVAGDDCLRRVAASLSQQATGVGGMVARYGGEEFVLLLPGLELAAAKDLAEAIRAGIQALAMPHAGAPSGRLTVSLGVAGRLPGADAPEDLLARADGALYAAKASGRDRVYLAATPAPEAPEEGSVQAAVDRAG